MAQSGTPPCDGRRAERGPDLVGEPVAPGAGSGRIFPDAELHLRIGNTGELRGMLLVGEIDIALCHADRLDMPRAFAIEGLRLDKLVVLVAGTERLAAGVRSRWRTSQRSRSSSSVRARASGWRCATQANVVPNMVFGCADLLAAVSLICRGLGATLVQRSVARQPGPSPSVLCRSPARWR
jgi:DNA-binding transcriptional LysR family regulator